MNGKLKFIGKVTAVHIMTYILCGIVFSTFFNYQELFQLGSAKYFMKSYEGTSILIGPLVQVVRGLLFGVVLLLIRDYFSGRYGWLRLWVLIAIVGIINTPAPAPFSIEGIIYTQLPLEVHLKGAPEILIQTLLFSYLIAKPKRQRRQIRFIEENKTAVVAAVIAGIGISLSGIVLTLILKLDVMAGAKDPGAFGIMFTGMIIVFLATKWYTIKASAPRAFVIALVYYTATAVLPTVYNFMVDSPFKSYLSLVISIVPVVIMLCFVHFSKSRAKGRLNY